MKKYKNILIAFVIIILLLLRIVPDLKRNYRCEVYDDFVKKYLYGEVKKNILIMMSIRTKL